MNYKLTVFRCDEVSLVEALAAMPAAPAELGRWPALVYTPERCCFALLDGQTLLDHDGKPLPLASVFEARVFGPPCELRWHHDGRGRGRAALLSAEPRGTPKDAWESEDLCFVDTKDNYYLLWGKVDQTRGEWTSLFEARIGELHVPFVPKPGADYIQLTAVEYLGAPKGDTHGNVRVIEERLTGFERHSPKVGRQK